jgi:hypothetical protein
MAELPSSRRNIGARAWWYLAARRCRRRFGADARKTIVRRGHNVVAVSVATGVAVALVIALSACSGAESDRAAVVSAAPVCPKSSRAGWQALANKVRARVYCPSWLPYPLDERFDGVFNGQTVDPDRSYLVKFLFFDAGLPGGPQEVHVIFRGYPGDRRLPRCDNSTVEDGKVVHHFSPCFSDPKGKKRFGSKLATLYTSNQGADQWHLLYAWRENASLYTVSEHVAAPYTYAQVLHNLNRMMSTLVRIQPRTAQTS